MTTPYIINNPMRKQLIKDRALRTVWLAFAIGVVMIVPFMIKDGGYFFYYGDFNVQQVSFWEYVAECIKGGNTGWSWETDLGSPLIPSYSFYMLGSPFFWLALIFPSSWMPHLMGPLLILKMVAAALGAYLLMQKYVKDPDYAVIGALLYAFSSYTVYNIFFNHFIDVVAVFPFLVLAFDELVENKRWGFFALMTGVALLTNYFFFVGEVVFLILYYFIRVCSKGSWRFEIKTFLHILLEGFVGVATTMAVMLPSYIMVSGNPRLNSMFNGWGFYIYGETRRYLDIIEALFFPPELPHYCYFVENGNTRWQSVAAWLPLVAMTCVIAYLASKKSKGTWQKRITVFFGLALLMPGIGSIFYLMKSTYYSRWLYMAVLVIALMTAIVLERNDQYDVKLGIKWNAIFSGLLVIPIAFLPVLGSKQITQVGLYVRSWGADVMFWICAAIGVGSIVAFALLYNKLALRGKRSDFKKYLTIALTITICAYSIFILSSGKASSESTTQMKDNSVEAKDFVIPGEDYSDNEFFRIDVLDGMDNQGLFWRQSSINFFQSTVSPSIMEFYESIGVTRDVATRPDTTHKGLRALTSVKYVFERYKDDGTMNSGYQSLPNLEYVGDMYGHAVFKNNNYINFGFTYKFYTTSEYASTVAKEKMDTMLINAILLDDEQAAKYGSMMMLADSPLYTIDYSDDGIASAAAARNEESCYNYVRSSDGGFTAEIDLSADNLVFFSMSYDEGWSATVNGKEVAVEKVNNGLVAIPATAGHCEIKFTYVTPGSKTGTIITIVGCAALLGLFAVEILHRVKKGKRALLTEMTEEEYNELPECEDLGKTDLKGSIFGRRKAAPTETAPTEPSETGAPASGDAAEGENGEKK